MDLLEQTREITGSITNLEEADTLETTKAALLSQKRQILGDFIDKNPKIIPSIVGVKLIEKGKLIDLLVSKNIGNSIFDKIIRSGLGMLGQKDRLLMIHEKTNSVSTSEELENFKEELLEEVGVISRASMNVLDSSTSVQDSSTSIQDSSTSVSDVVSSQGSSVSTDHLSQVERGKNIDWKGFNPDIIRSQPLRKNPKTGVTLCAATAKFNALNFGIELPSGNAYDAGAVIPQTTEYQLTLPETKKSERPSSRWSSLKMEDFDQVTNANFADIYPESKSKYGHRAVAFRAKSGEWYVLDPYLPVNGVRDTKPKLLSDYAKGRKLVKSHFYVASGYEKQVA